jgi:hypothetical protein
LEHKLTCNYLIHQVDEQLLSVVGGTADRLDRAGIEDDHDNNTAKSRPVTPLNQEFRHLSL